MTTQPRSLVPRCPDCGGILEPVRPRWTSTLDAATAAPALPQADSDWRCLLCGYRTAGLPMLEPAEPVRTARAHAAVAIRRNDL